MTSGASVRTVSQVHKAARQMVAPKPPGATKGISFSSQRNKRAAAAAGASSSKTPELPAVSTSAAAGPDADLAKEIMVLKKLNMRLEADCGRLGAAEAAAAGQMAQLQESLAWQQAKTDGALAKLSGQAATLAERLAEANAKLLAAQRDAAEAGRAAAGPCEACESMRAELDKQRGAVGSAGRARSTLQQQVEQLKAACAAKEQSRFDEEQARQAAGAEAAAARAALAIQMAAAAAAQEAAPERDADAAVAAAELVSLQEKLQRFAGSLSTHKAEAAEHEARVAVLEQKLAAEAERATSLRLQLDSERDRAPEVAEKNALREKVRRQEELAKQREASHGRATASVEAKCATQQRLVAALKKQLEAAAAGPGVGSVAEGDANLWEKCKQQMQEQFDDDSYEAVLLEELAEMRERFQQQVDALTESLKDTKAMCHAEIRAEESRWEEEKKAVERRCLDLETRCSQYEAQLEQR